MAVNHSVSFLNLNIPPWRTFLFAIILGTLLNSTFNVISASFGAAWPKTYFLFDANDAFADFFKVVLSFPGEGVCCTGLNTSRLAGYMVNNPYGSTEALQSGALTHFHHPPLYELIFVLCRKLFEYINPWIVYFGLIITLVGAFSVILNKYCADRKIFITYLWALFLSYPFLMAVSRGNIGSLIVAFSLIVSLMLTQRRIYPLLACSLIAVAANFKPNAIVFGFLLVLIYPPRTAFKFILVLALETLTIAWVSFFIVNNIYSDYTIESFLSGLRVYHNLYVIGNAGVDYGSSLFGAMVLISSFFDFANFFPSNYLEYVAILLSLASLLYLFYLKRRVEINHDVLSFSIFCVYVIGTPVFADYHLLVVLYFVLVVAEKLKESLSLDSRMLIILFTSFFLCIPKNYLFIHGHSFQQLLNPLSIVISLCLIYCFTKKESERICHDSR